MNQLDCTKIYFLSKNRVLGSEGAKTAWAQFSAFLIGNGGAPWEELYGWSPPKLQAENEASSSGSGLA